MSLRAQSQAPCLTSSPESLTAAFVKFCRVQQITTRNLCRVGYITRQYTPGPARAASTSSSSSSSVPTSTTSPVLRGLIANKDIAKDENIVMMPERACLHHGVALRCQPFMNLIPTEVQQEHFLTRAFVLNSRVANGALIRHHQLLLALYMTYLYLSHTHAPSTLAALPDAKWMGYLNFLPRTEGDFALLKQHLTGWLYGTPVCRTLQKKLASHFGIDEENVRDALCYALCMLYSRSVPVDHYATLEYAFRGTAVAEYVTALKPLSTNGLVSEPVTFMAPLIDLCNHSEFENVAVMIPDRPLSSASTEPVICLRSLRDIAKNEELTMTYGGSPRELSLIWGMKQVLV